MMKMSTGRSSNGKTAASGAAYRGSSPCLPATISRGSSMILRASLLLLPILALAQEQAPPDVDQELRARVSGFYQNFLDDSYSPRKAEPYVAEDTKDYFYNALKQKYQSFQIVKITYSDNFTKAVVVVSSRM